MRQTTTYFITLFVIILTIWSCQTVIDYEDTDFTPQLAIHSFFAPDSTWEVHVSQTKSIFDDNTDLALGNADVIIEDITSHQVFRFEHIGDGKYGCSNTPTSNHVYHLTVEEEELGRAHAIGSVPSVDHIEVLTTVEDNASGQHLNISLISKSGQHASDAFIAWQLVELDDQEASDGDNIVRDDEHVVTIRGGLEDLNFIPVGHLDGNTVHDSFTSETINQVVNDGVIQNLEDDIALKLIAISKDLYHHYQINTQNHHNQPSVQSTSYSNMIGGVGVFGGYSETLIRL